MLAAPPEELRAELAALPGIGPKMAESFASYFADPAQREVAQKLLDLGVVAHEPEPVAQAAVSGPLNGKTFCVTGVLSKPREAIHETIRAAGGEIHDRVKKGTTYLVAGDKVGETKLKAARKNQTEVITEAQLDSLIAGA